MGYKHDTTFVSVDYHFKWDILATHIQMNTNINFMKAWKVPVTCNYFFPKKHPSTLQDPNIYFINVLISMDPHVFSVPKMSTVVHNQENLLRSWLKLFPFSFCLLEGCSQTFRTICNCWVVDKFNKNKNKSVKGRVKGLPTESIPPLQKALDFRWKSSFPNTVEVILPSGHSSKVQTVGVP